MASEKNNDPWWTPMRGLSSFVEKRPIHGNQHLYKPFKILPADRGKGRLEEKMITKRKSPRQDPETGEWFWGGKWYDHYPNEEIEDYEGALDDYYERKLGEWFWGGKRKSPRQDPETDEKREEGEDDSKSWLFGKGDR